MMNAGLLIATALACVLLVRLLSIGLRGRNLPPGLNSRPPTLPLIGNLHQLPKKDIHVQHLKWAQEYGPIFSLKLGSQTVIVLASGSMIKRLVDKRSANYADRPSLFMQGVFEQSRIILRGYDDLWKVERKLYHGFMNSTKAARYAPYQDLETKQLCFDLLGRPEAFEALITRMTFSAATSMTYGFRVTDPQNPVMQELLKNAHGFLSMVHKSQLFDWYPQLRPIVKWVPSFMFLMYRDAREVFRREKIQFHQLLDDARRNMNDENALPSFAADIARAQESWKGKPDGAILTDRAAAYIAGIAMEGATDTQSNQLASFIKAMTLYPDCQTKAQKELEEVVGPDRMPDANDLDKLRYLRQVMKETLRCKYERRTV
ncbi:putative Cytochrome P450 oxidoreductase [Cladophialophora carrionii]|uniref:Putative Cytochrome P450 oxidoreductase n=1 Tax=Cladophialophora carrionii TaxID=86049 RepID=A0A1C1CPS0_9EURO|nr:putative Cytochrome P450 oxidoreductase [Cladophialophora carrionii]